MRPVHALKRRFPRVLEFAAATAPTPGTPGRRARRSVRPAADRTVSTAHFETGWGWTHGPPPVNPTTSESRTVRESADADLQRDVDPPVGRSMGDPEPELRRETSGPTPRSGSTRPAPASQPSVTSSANASRRVIRELLDTGAAWGRMPRGVAWSSAPRPPRRQRGRHVVDVRVGRHHAPRLPVSSSGCRSTQDGAPLSAPAARLLPERGAAAR